MLRYLYGYIGNDLFDDPNQIINFSNETSLSIDSFFC